MSALWGGQVVDMEPLVGGGVATTLVLRAGGDRPSFGEETPKWFAGPWGESPCGCLGPRDSPKETRPGKLVLPFSGGIC
jgi:hypothetical protein